MRKKMRNAKGFIFTLDAVMALIVIMVLATVLVIQYQTAESQGGLYQKSFENSHDDAIINFYLGINAEDELGSNLSCYTYYRYEPQNGAGQGIAEEKKVCR